MEWAADAVVETGTIEVAHLIGGRNEENEGSEGTFVPVAKLPEAQRSSLGARVGFW